MTAESTDRDEDVRARTLRRMKAEGIPQGTDDPILLALGAKPLPSHYCRIVMVSHRQQGLNPRYYATCHCGWNSPMYRTSERAWDDGKDHQRVSDG